MLKLKQISRLGLALSLPIVSADSKQGKSKQEDQKPSRVMKPSQLPIYEEPSDFFNYEYYGKEKGKLQEGISVVRKEFGSVYEATADVRDSVKHVYETGKAHSMSTVDYILDEENVAAKVGAISVGAFLGLLIGGRRKGFLKKMFYTTVGGAGTAALVYPKESSKMCQEVYNNAGDYSLIAYNFVAGIKPQSETIPSAPAEPAKVSPPKPSSPAEVSPRTKNEEDLFQSLLRQSRDVSLWGFRLFDPKTMPESSGELARGPEHPLRDKFSSEVPREEGSISSQVVEIMKDLAEEEVASLVDEAAGRAEITADEFSQEAKTVGAESRKAERILSVVEMASEAAEKTEHMSPSLKKKAEVVDEIAKKLEGVAEVIEKVADTAELVGREVSEIAKEVKVSAHNYVEANKEDAVRRVEEVLSDVGKIFQKDSKSIEDKPDTISSEPSTSESKEKTTEDDHSQLEVNGREEPKPTIGFTPEQVSFELQSSTDDANHPVNVFQEGDVNPEDDFIRIVGRSPAPDTLKRESGPAQIEDFADSLIESMLNIKVLPPEEGEVSAEEVAVDTAEDVGEEDTDYSSSELHAHSLQPFKKGIFISLKEKLFPKEAKEETEIDIDEMDKKLSLEAPEGDTAEEIQSPPLERDSDEGEETQLESVVPVGVKVSMKPTPVPAKPAPPPKDVVVKAPKAPAAPIQGDLGMSNPEDKDMYTTRG